MASVTDIGIQKGLHEYKLGLVTQIYTDNAESLSESVKLTGGHFGYAKIIHTDIDWLDLEFKSDLIIQHFKSAWVSNIWDEAQQQYIGYDYTLKELLITASAGYGLRVNLSKKLYLSQSVNGGIFYSGILVDEVADDAPPFEKEFDFRQYKDFGFQWTLQFTVGYRLGKLR